MTNRVFLGLDGNTPALKVSQPGINVLASTNPRQFLVHTGLAGSVLPVLADATFNCPANDQRFCDIQQGAATVGAFSYAFKAATWPIGVSAFDGFLSFANGKWIHNSLYFDDGDGDSARLHCFFHSTLGGPARRRYSVINNFNRSVTCRIVEFGRP